MAEKRSKRLEGQGDLLCCHLEDGPAPLERMRVVWKSWEGHSLTAVTTKNQIPLTPLLHSESGFSPEPQMKAPLASTLILAW